MQGLVEPYERPPPAPHHPKDGQTTGVMILKALFEADRPLTTPELQELIPRSERMVTDALLNLRRCGIIVYGRPPSQGRHGWPPGKYRLRPAAENFLKELQHA